MAKRLCKACKNEKEESDFYASSPNKCKRCVLDRQSELRTNAGSGTSSKVKGTAKKKKAKKKRAAAMSALARKPADAKLTRHAGMGFTVQLEVDGGTGLTDVKLSQFNPTSNGDQLIWLSQHEAAELQAWLSANLAES